MQYSRQLAQQQEQVPPACLRRLWVMVPGQERRQLGRRVFPHLFCHRDPSRQQGHPQLRRQGHRHERRLELQ